MNPSSALRWQRSPYDREILRLALPALGALAAEPLYVLVALMQPLNAIVFVLYAVLIGAGDARYLAWAMGGALPVYVPGALLVLAHGTLVWLWVALGGFMAVRWLGVGARFSSGRWTRIGMVSSPHPK